MASRVKTGATAGAGNGNGAAANGKAGKAAAAAEAKPKPFLQFDPHLTPKSSTYRSAQVVGEGVFGDVRKCFSKKMKKFYALKKIKYKKAEDGFPVTALREIQITQRLSHPNVIKLKEVAVTPAAVHDIGDDRFCYLVFPVIEHDLCGLIGNKDWNPKPNHIKCLIQQLFRGLKYIHANSILHRDIKSANILVSRHGVLKIADFGLARPYRPESVSAQYTGLICSRWYRPPEILLGVDKYAPAHYTAAVDIWSAACVVGELVARDVILKSRAGKSDKELDITQLTLIHELCGSQEFDTWRAWRDSWISFKDKRRSTLSQRFTPKASALGGQHFARQFVKFAMFLFRVNPDARPTATAVLAHDFFKSTPPPSLPSEVPLPQEECREINTRRSRPGHSKQSQQQSHSQQHQPRSHSQQQPRSRSQQQQRRGPASKRAKIGGT
ncbi:CMGC/CDK protein kinase [Salpingoeca rosetta]|uniref:CMGC/CDK protein kinase n=1 Tax=Salpingoeca rosetta (strain ATCC 50818 / BSB-021) TaxID=946362 RepID=F2UQI4_SALR5|nr:CMGC/CDK protein kinase [Salpingoeca rosetta]EGD79889.1 CMGC/CDK protein kinase [Salpingoeca rosetta]|eukprot:XP_004988510.1 CMGC/CDK protein kinase [Salpingoeca rosetta]